MEIVLEGVSKGYGRGARALSSVDLTIGGGMYGLLGPNGAGKTTLMKILAGIIKPTSGSVRIGGHDCNTEAGRRAVKRGLGYLPQELGLYPDLSAGEFLDYVGILKGLENKAQRHDRVEHLLATVGLEEVRNRKLKGFSGGMKRRVGIAQALLNDPGLLIVDEPTAGLDPEERIRFRNLLSELAAERTVLLSTHIVEDVAQTGRQLCVLVGGEILFQGTTPELIEAAQGKVWTIDTDGPRPGGDLTVVSTLHLGESVRYRVVGEPGSVPEASAADPSLEDGYVWLMRKSRVTELA
ncbi:ABC transporter ATP-binding protein [Rubrobacter aplysinae]|uniref:ABC transporter ATP-binding protein n=1 Tax=Rubrobacter aplysinae TaxID=909625 RepID=UPI00064BA4CC|nr:ABC transporter ATP-binding protein [Rubrobacter aplysinae]